MKIYFALFFVGLFILSTSFKSSGNHLVKVYLKNIKAKKGTAYVNLYSSEGFPKGGKQLQQKTIKMNTSSAYVVFSVPNGSYAIAMYHDVNDNGEMDKNWIGYPLEPYGFSKNFKPTVSEPDFSDCKFVINNTGKSLTINLIQ